MTETSLKKRYSTKLFASIVSGLIGMVIVAIVPKAIGPVAYGQFIYLQQFFTKIIGFLDAGSSIAFFTKLSAKPGRKELITFYLIYSLLVLTVLSVFLTLGEYYGITEYYLPDVGKEFIYWGLCLGFLTWFTQLSIKLSDAYALTASIEMIKIAHKICSLCLLIYLVEFSSLDLITYFYFNAVTLLTFLFVVAYFFYKNNIFPRNILFIHLEKVKLLVLEFVGFCSPLLIYSLAGLVFGLFDIWLLQSTGGSVETGYYGLAYSIAAMCFIFTGAMTPIITREFSKSFDNQDFKTMRLLFKRYIPMFYSLACYFSIFIAFQAENVLEIFTDENFSGALMVLVVMAIYPIHQTYGQLSGSIFYATGQTKLYRNIGLISMFVGFILTVILLYSFELNAVGLAFKMVISQMIAVNIQLFYNSKFLGLKMRDYLKHQIISIMFFAVIAFLAGFLVDVGSPLLSFFLSGLIYTLLVFIGFLVYPMVFGVSRKYIKEKWLKKISFG